MVAEVLAGALIAMAVWQETPESREMAQDFLEAIEEAHLSLEQAADYMGISKSALSDQLANRKHLSLWRTANLPLAAQTAFYRNRMRRTGCTVIEDGRLAQLVKDTADLVAAVEKLDQLPKRMAVMHLDVDGQQKRTA